MQLNELSSTLMSISSGKDGTIDTLQIMRDVCRKGKSALPVIVTARRLISKLPQKDKYAEIKACFDYVQSNIRYVRDINGIEMMQYPAQTIQLESGDCDDKSILLAALLESIGFSTRFCAVGKKQDEYFHVYPEVYFNGKWIALETTEPVEMGWKAPLNRRLIIHN